ncbi:MAG: SBBP repeat-containing protein [Polyangiales bacterium]
MPVARSWLSFSLLSFLALGCADGSGPCPDGTYGPASGGGSACTPWTECGPGSYVATAGTATEDRVCAACAGGTYAATPNQDTCAPVTVCAPGSFVAAEASAANDRACAACASGTYSTTSNAASCAAWTACDSSSIESVEPSATRDRQCEPTEWTSVFGTSATDNARALVFDPSGRVFVVGDTNGALTGATNAGGFDIAVVEVDSQGHAGSTDQLGSPAYDTPSGGAYASDGRLFVLGTSNGLLGQATLGSFDLVLRTYASGLSPTSTFQFGTAAQDVSGGAVVDASGNLYVCGIVYGALGDQTALGNADAFVQKYDATGTLVWTRQFGTSAYDAATAVALTSTGTVVVSGYVNGALPGKTGAGSYDAFLRGYDADGNVLFTDQNGTSAIEYGVDVATDANGGSYLLVRTDGTYPMQTSAGGTDAVVVAYDADGLPTGVRQFGTSGTDTAMAIAATPAGVTYVVGPTNGTFPTLTYGGGLHDGFLARLDATLVVTNVRAIASSGDDVGVDVAYDPRGRVVVAGTTSGTLDGHAAVGPSDFFVRAFAP